MAIEKHSIVTLFILWSCFSGTYLEKNRRKIGSCKFIEDAVCPDPSINFFLYTRKNQLVPQMVTVENITSSNFQTNLPNKFILHGFTGQYTMDVLQNMKNEYLKASDLNVWMIDYSGVSAGPTLCYVAAVRNLPKVGKCAAEMVRRIMELARVKDPDQVMHLVGFSLGGQLAGQVAEQVKPLVLPRITGLDPALPMFYTGLGNRRLSDKDAQFVDVIHTNALVKGQWQSCGHVDFYVNGGTTQPSCENSKDQSSCDHAMAPTYFTESISSKTGFWGGFCPSKYDFVSGKCPVENGERQLMGEHACKSARGQFLVAAKNVPPYAMGNLK